MQLSLDQIAAEVRRIFAADPAGAATAIEDLMTRQMDGLEDGEQYACLLQLKEQFFSPPAAAPGGGSTSAAAMDDAVFHRFCTLLLGPSVSPDELSAPEVMERLTASLNTVFDILNKLIQAINATLYDSGDPEATIRHVIGMQMSDEQPGKSLEDYLGQIKNAFLTTQEAHKAATRTMVERLLGELDPEALAEENSGGFSFGRLRKGDYFDRYTQKYATCRKWFDSPRFMEDLLRDFEKNCHRLAQQQRR